MEQSGRKRRHPLVEYRSESSPRCGKLTAALGRAHWRGGRRNGRNHAQASYGRNAEGHARWRTRPRATTLGYRTPPRRSPSRRRDHRRGVRFSPPQQTDRGEGTRIRRASSRAHRSASARI